MNIATAGHRGTGTRSDLWVELELRPSGGIELNLQSKVDFMYGEANRKLVQDVLKAMGIGNARVNIEDTGALPFVIMARLEAAARRLLPEKKLPAFLPDAGPSFRKPTTRDRWRRSRLYLPGDEPRFMLNARIHGPDAVILDLEDSVPPGDKDAALLLVRNALHTVDYGDCERMVRINQLPRGMDELEPLVLAGVNVILIPKCEDDDEVEAIDKHITGILKDHGLKHDVFLMPIIETCEGMFKARKIARASKRVIALTYGLEDYIADLGGIKTPGGTESLWARSQVVNAAKAAGVQAIDTVFGNVDDSDALAASCQAAKELGFEGKGCIHPRQVPVVNRAFTPSEPEIEAARRIVFAFRQAQSEGHGVVAVGSKMVDAPVVKRALKTIELALAAGCLAADWEEQAEKGA